MFHAFNSQAIIFAENTMGFDYVLKLPSYSHFDEGIDWLFYEEKLNKKTAA